MSYTSELLARIDRDMAAKDTTIEDMRAQVGALEDYSQAVGPEHSSQTKRESSRGKRDRLRGTFTPTKATGYNRKQRQSIAVGAVREGKAELLDAGCDLLEARKEAVKPRRVSVGRLLRSVWKKRKLERETKSAQRKTVEQ